MSDVKNRSSPELSGTPLVTCLGKGIHSGADIQDAVNTLLTPLSRRKNFLPSDQSKPIEENGTYPGIDADELLENCNPYSGPYGHSKSNLESETISNGRRHSFQLLFWDIDERCFNKIENDAFVESEAAIIVFLEWRDKENELYNASILKNLPVVFKSGLVKPREKVSLFSCLEAFLKEEPLGLDDTWLVTFLNLHCSYLHCLVHSYLICSFLIVIFFFFLL